MIKNSVENASVFVVTRLGGEPDADELANAARLSYSRGFIAKEMCSRVGDCSIRVSHLVEGDKNTGQIDTYSLVCDNECLPGISKADTRA